MQQQIKTKKQQDEMMRQTVKVLQKWPLVMISIVVRPDPQSSFFIEGKDENKTKQQDSYNDETARSIMTSTSKPTSSYACTNECSRTNANECPSNECV